LIRLFTGAAVALVMLLAMVSGAAAQVQVTPNFEVTPTTDTTAWVIWMAIGAIVITVLLVAGITAGYMRFAPKFFGREEAAARPPGARPPHLARQAATLRRPVGATRPASTEGPSTPSAPAQAPAAVAAPAPATAPAPAAPGPTPAPEPAQAADAAATTSTAGPESEPAVQADAVGAAEAAAPEPRPSAKTPEEVGTRPRPAPVTGSVGMDQETFDRVLEEQLGKGVDRRVAEGRARAAAVVAARKRAQAER
jgi:hypothetical protein